MRFSIEPSFLLFSFGHFFLPSVCQSSHPTLLLTFTPSETLYRPRKNLGLYAISRTF